MINLFLIGKNGMGENGVASTLVEEFIEENKPKAIAVNLGIILGLENVEIKVGSTKQCLMTSLAKDLFALRHDEKDKDKSFIIKFDPQLKGKDVIIFNPTISEEPEEINTVLLNEPIPSASGVVEEIERVMNIEVKLPEPLVKVPFLSLESSDSRGSPTLFFKGEARKKARSMIKELKNLC